MSLRIVGVVACIAVVGWTGYEVVTRAAPEPPTPTEAPPGFEQIVGGLGAVETAFQGHVSLLTEERREAADGVAELVPVLAVEGEDPVPFEGGMQLRDAVVQRPAIAGEAGNSLAGFVIRAPTGRIPLVEGTSTLTADRTKPWSFDEPVMEIPLDGRPFEIRAPDAVLDPTSALVRSDGVFTAEGAGLALRGVGIEIDPVADELRFGAPGEWLEWSFVDAGGHEYSGRSDDAGRLFDDGERGRRLTIGARELCTLSIPEATGFSGEFECSGLDLWFAPSSRGWLPRRGESLGPVAWSGTLDSPFASTSAAWLDDAAVPTPLEPADGEPDTFGLATFGVFYWDDEGLLQGADLRGPMHMHYDREPGGFLFADGGAFFETRPSRLFLYDRVSIWDDTGWHRADWIWLLPGEMLGRSVTLRNGALLGEELVVRDDGTRLLRGHAALVDRTAGFKTGAPELSLDAMGRGRADGGFRVIMDGDEPWTVQGQTMSLGEVAGKQRILAEKELAVQRAGVHFLGDQLIHLQDTRTIISGLPATASLESDAGPVDASARRFIFEKGRLILDDGPFLEVPAAAFGLEGDTVQIESRFMDYDPIDEAWVLKGGVTFQGGVNGSSRTARWAPYEGLTLTGGEDLAYLAGRTVLGEDFALNGKSIVLDPEGTAELESNARAAFASADGRHGEMSGFRGSVGPDSGWFEESALLTIDAMTASASRIEWSPVPLRDGELGADGEPRLEQEIRLLGDAVLSDGEGVDASGETIHLRPESGILEVIGTAEEPARIDLPDGRSATGEWLRFDRRHNLLDSGKGKFERTPPR